ncbi:MAG: carbon storage regulator [Pirellulaceae bacterium]|nr:carbon storage regulator [Pirellulaceae bacterium]
MLVLSRKVSEKLVIGDNITITVTRIAGNRVTLGIEAPGDVRVMRGELKRSTEPAPEATSVAPKAVPALSLVGSVFESHTDTKDASLPRLAK